MSEQRRYVRKERLITGDGSDPCIPLKLKLDSFDKGKPDEQRAVFHFLPINSRQTCKIGRLRKEAFASTDIEETDKLINEALLESLVNWENVKDAKGGVEFSPEALDQFSVELKIAMANEYPWALMFAERTPAPRVLDSSIIG
jgi:hypothetical protein